MKYNVAMLWKEIREGRTLCMRQFLTESPETVGTLLAELSTKDKEGVAELLSDLNDRSHERVVSASVAMCRQSSARSLKALLVVAITQDRPTVIKTILENLHSNWDHLADISVPLAARNDLSGIFATLEALFAKQERYFRFWHFDGKGADRNISAGRAWIRDLTPLITPQLTHLLSLALVASTCPDYPAEIENQLKSTKQLCAQECGFTTNTLLLVSRKHDDTWGVTSGLGRSERYVNYDLQRRLATDEIEKRGNPCFSSDSWYDIG